MAMAKAEWRRRQIILKHDFHSKAEPLADGVGKAARIIATPDCWSA